MRLFLFHWGLLGDGWVLGGLRFHGDTSRCEPHGFRKGKHSSDSEGGHGGGSGAEDDSLMKGGVWGGGGGANLTDFSFKTQKPSPAADPVQNISVAPKLGRKISLHWICRPLSPDKIRTTWLLTLLPLFWKTTFVSGSLLTGVEQLRLKSERDFLEAAAMTAKFRAQS